MIKRVFTLLTLLICLYSTALANREISVELDTDNRNHNERLGFANVTFDYLYNVGNQAIVKVSIENITQDPPLAVLVFRRDIDEKTLKKGKPKIEFEKKYPGEKGKRRVVGCGNDRYRSLDIITATEKDSLITLYVPFKDTTDIMLPLYVAKYKSKDLHKKGENDIKYKIFEEYLYDIHVRVDGWSEEDSTYVCTKRCVEQFIASLDSVEFCNNPKHKPLLEEQQRPYKEAKDSLINVINTIIHDNDWMSDHAPHMAYTKLLNALNDVNLDENVSDCGKHPVVSVGGGARHLCNYCSLSAQQVFHNLDNLYQQLYVGRITKEQALKIAKGLYKCYLGNKKRPIGSYGSKITQFYNKIAEF